MKQLTGRREDVTDMARHQPVAHLISQGTGTSQTAVEHFNSSTRTSSVDPALPLPVTRRQPKNNAQANTAVWERSGRHLATAPPLSFLHSPRPRLVIRLAPSPSELIKGAVSKVPLHFVYLCITVAPQITHTKGLSELLI